MGKFRVPEPAKALVFLARGAFQLGSIMNSVARRFRAKERHRRPWLLAGMRNLLPGPSVVAQLLERRRAA
jgi:hypothetical protein